jgi:hypothetical protein
MYYQIYARNYYCRMFTITVSLITRPGFSSKNILGLSFILYISKLVKILAVIWTGACTIKHFTLLITKVVFDKVLNK